MDDETKEILRQIERNTRPSGKVKTLFEWITLIAGVLGIFIVARDIIHILEVLL